MVFAIFTLRTFFCSPLAEIFANLDKIKVFQTTIQQNRKNPVNFMDIAELRDILGIDIRQFCLVTF